MKNINEYITENMINEAAGKIVAFFDHDEPENTWLVIGADDKMIKRIPHGYDIMDIPNKGNLIDITHSDEWGWHGITDLGCKTEAQLKSKIMKSIKDSLKDAEPDYAYIKFDPIPLDNEFEENVDTNPDTFYKALLEIYNYSYIDGDSASARMVYDPNKKEVVFGAGMNIICYTAEEFENVLKEWEE